MSDAICSYGGSVYQHGPYNNRIYLMKISSEDVPDIIPLFEKISKEYGYSKIFVKIPVSAQTEFLQQGYRVEARIPGLYNGIEDGIFMAKYPDERRSLGVDLDTIRSIIRESIQRAEKRRKSALPQGYVLAQCMAEDADAIAGLYGKTYESYPFPIMDPGYIRETMKENFRYYSIRKDQELVAVASTEIHMQESNVEMTDFATDTRYTGMNLAGHLLEWMEREMRTEGIRMAYTIARAHSYPINITFARAGYRYGGTLLNNTNICGSFESMNVWYKPL